MKNRSRRLEIAIVSLLIGVCIGYGSRYFRIPLLDPAADLRPELSTSPMLPNAAAINTGCLSTTALISSPGPAAEPPDEIVVLVDGAGAINEVSVHYGHVDEHFDLKSELVRRYGQLEHSYTIDLSDMGAFHDKQMGISWSAVLNQADEDQLFSTATISVRRMP